MDTQEKVVITFGERRKDIDIPHDIHQSPPIRNGMFAITNNGPDQAKIWGNVYVEGDDAQTKANIITNFGDKFVE